MPFLSAAEFFAAVDEDRKNGVHAAAEQRFRDAVADGIDHYPKEDWDKIRAARAELDELGGVLAGRIVPHGMVAVHLDAPEPEQS